MVPTVENPMEEKSDILLDDSEAVWSVSHTIPRLFGSTKHRIFAPLFSSFEFAFASALRGTRYKDNNLPMLVRASNLQ